MKSGLKMVEQHQIAARHSERVRRRREAIEDAIVDILMARYSNDEQPDSDASDHEEQRIGREDGNIEDFIADPDYDPEVEEAEASSEDEEEEVAGAGAGGHQEEEEIVHGPSGLQQDHQRIERVLHVEQETPPFIHMRTGIADPWYWRILLLFQWVALPRRQFITKLCFLIAMIIGIYELILHLLWNRFAFLGVIFSLFVIWMYEKFRCAFFD